MPRLSHEYMFWELYNSKNEYDVEEVIAKHPEYFHPRNWKPLGENESNFAVVENQQSNPIAALVEKIMNSIDATLMRKCLEASINPRSPQAPQSIEQAIERFFPDHKNWDLGSARNIQAENIQILADGKTKARNQEDTSIIIYDNGEGQHPQDFESTFLSLLRGNKNEIHFVQGKYNMGGSGAIAFCGKNRYQLIASRRYDKTGKFGFTLIRKHPLSTEEQKIKKNTWYEYLVVDGHIPSFAIDFLNLSLYKRKFETGTIIKLFSYDTKGNRHLRRDMARSINEFLYEPALPFYMVETEERYPNDNALTGVVFGLKRRLADSDYIEETFSETIKDPEMGNVKVTVHVFSSRSKSKNFSDTKKTIQNEFFKNNMSILFSMNGQVHGHYTSEFITRTLKFNILRDFLIIHVDCTHMKMDFRNELFMASRDRIKQGEEANYLRKTLGNHLSQGRLKELYKLRKASISVDTDDEESIFKDIAENLPINSDLRGLLSQTFKLDSNKKSQKQPRVENKKPVQHTEFNPKRYPSFFNLNGKKQGDQTILSLPLNGSKTVEFDSDVENQYFDRVDDPGDMEIAVMTYTPNKTTGGDQKGDVNDISDILAVSRRSPHNGKIKVVFNPTENIQVGDEIEVKVDLHSPSNPDGTFQQVFWIKITDPLPPNPEKVEHIPEDEKLGLPKHVLVHEKASEDHPNRKIWEDLQDYGIDMSYDMVMYPLLEGETLDTIYMNMDSSTIKKYKSKLKSIEQIQIAERRYITSMYFHTLFLYVINKNLKFRIFEDDKNNNGQLEVDLDKYLSEVFSSYYTEFLLNFGTSELMESLG